MKTTSIFPTGDRHLSPKSQTRVECGSSLAKGQDLLGDPCENREHS